jgi:hypothetical protein
MGMLQNTVHLDKTDFDQAWVQFGVPLDECGPLVERLIAAVHDDELCDVAFDALSSMVNISHSSFYLILKMTVLFSGDQYLFLNYQQIVILILDFEECMLFRRCNG